MLQLNMKCLNECRIIAGNLLISRNFHTCTVLFRETPRNLSGKKHSSQLWLMRQLKDPYVEKAKQEHYRCRSAFKLLEINEKYNILKPGQIIIDCGAAPGSWTQVAVRMTNADAKKEEAIGTVFAIDRQPISPIKGATLLGGLDFTVTASQDKMLKLLNGSKADIILSDMAPNACGVKDLDHDNIVQLIYAALRFALQVTRIDGTFVAKVWDGGKSQQIEKDLLKFYKSVKCVRPQATRYESTEKFFLARGFKGIKGTHDYIT